MNNLVKVEVLQFVDGLQVSNVVMNAEPGRPVSNRTACNIAANRMNNLIETVRFAKRNGTKIGFKMNALTYVKVWNDGELVLDSRAESLKANDCGLMDSFTFRGVTNCDNKRAQVIGALEVSAQLNSTLEF